MDLDLPDVTNPDAGPVAAFSLLAVALLILALS
jgi:hypothetical protein